MRLRVPLSELGVSVCESESGGAPAGKSNNQKGSRKIKQSKSHEYHFPIPLVFSNQNNQNPGKIPVNRKHCPRLPEARGRPGLARFCGAPTVQYLAASGAHAAGPRASCRCTLALALGAWGLAPAPFRRFCVRVPMVPCAVCGACVVRVHASHRLPCVYACTVSVKYGKAVRRVFCVVFFSSPVPVAPSPQFTDTVQ